MTPENQQKVIDKLVLIFYALIVISVNIALK